MLPSTERVHNSTSGTDSTSSTEMRMAKEQSHVAYGHQALKPLALKPLALT